MRVLFFARLRELQGSDHLELPPESVPDSVAALRAVLRTTATAELAEALADDNVLCAVNRQVVDDGHPLEEGDEIAFFPPVTGG